MVTRALLCVRKVALAAALAVPALSGGCGGGSSSGGPGGGATVSAPSDVNAFAAAYAHAVCDNAAACCQSNALTYNAANCLTAAEGIVQAFLVNPAIASGGTYSQSAASACLTAVTASVVACNDLVASTPQSTQIASCNAVIAGTKQPGDPCTQSTDCAPPADGTVSCLDFTSTTGSSDGGSTSVSVSLCQVTVPGTTGAACNNDIVGAGSLPARTTDCGQAASAFNCVNGVCQAKGAVGATCLSGLDCVSTAYCNGGTCAARQPLGAACDAVADSCDAATYCEPTTTTCTARLAAGMPCTSAVDQCLGECQSNVCRSSSIATASYCGGG